MKPTSGRQLREILDSYTDLQRYALLATIRTGKQLSEKDRELRWYMLRMIVVRAYQQSYKRSYSVYREWHEIRGRSNSLRYRGRCTSYELEQNRILELIRHIKAYHSPKGTPLPGYTKDMMAVACALKGYYRRFTNYDCHLMFELDGVSFREYKLKHYGTVREHRVAYSQLFNLHRLLHKANWDTEQALRLWVEECQRLKDVKTLSKTASAYDGRAKEPTVAMVIGTYGRLIRHKSIKDLVESYSIEALAERDGESSDTWEENITPVCKHYHDVHVRLEQIKKEVAKRASIH